MKNFQKIICAMHKAIIDFNLIKDGDKIAIGVSGGKDSLCMLKALATYRKFAKEKFELTAITVDLFDGKYSLEKISNFCHELGIEHTIIKSQIAEIIFDIRKESNPCSLCANMRRGMLNNAAKELGCNKVALAHHKDDLVETFFLSMFYEGRLSTFQPMTYLSNVKLEVIRPFIYVDEKLITNEISNLPVFKNPCQVDHKTQREEIKKLIEKLDKQFNNCKKNISNSLINTSRYNLLDKLKK